jgi:hypothetical protein
MTGDMVIGTSKFLIFITGLFLVNTLFAQTWTGTGWTIQDPSGPPPPGYIESGSCVTANTGASGYNGISRLYKDANVDLTSASSGFTFTFDLNFGSDVTQGDGFSFTIMSGISFGANGGRLGFSDMSSDNITFEWDTYVNTAAEGDEAGVPAQHMGISAYNGGASELANEISMGSEIRDGANHRASITWVPDGSGGGTFTQTIVNGTTKTLTATLTAAQLSAYAFATSADFSFQSATNVVAPQTQSTCLVSTTPINLLYFSGNFSDNKIELAWSTAQEINNKEFNILRSYDGILWTVIGVVQGANNSSYILNYSFTDQSYMSGTQVYYQLKQIDYDGQEESFETIVITSESENRMCIVPNPSNGQFILTFTKGISTENFYCRIYDIKGREIHAKSIEVSGKNVFINANDLPAGMYYLRLRNGNSSHAEKFIID